MTWEQNIHSSMFYNAYSFLLKSGYCTGVEAVIRAYRLYLEQCPDLPEVPPLLALTRAWTLVRFVDSGMLQLSRCNCCGGDIYHPCPSTTKQFCLQSLPASFPRSKKT